MATAPCTATAMDTLMATTAPRHATADHAVADGNVMPRDSGDPAPARDRPGSSVNRRLRGMTTRSWARRATAARATDADLARLMTWLSPAFPVGAFSYSHGLEWAVEAGTVRDAATLGDWIEDVLRHGAGRTDAILLAEAWRAVAAATTALAEPPSWPRRSRPRPSGASRRWRRARPSSARLRGSGRSPRLGGLARRRAEVAYPVAVGAAAAAHGLAAGLRRRPSCRPSPPTSSRPACALVPLGQTDGLRAAGAAGAADRRAWSRAGAGQPRSTTSAAPPRCVDIASMRHETQYTRLFRPEEERMTKSPTAPCASASAARSAPARRR